MSWVHASNVQVGKGRAAKMKMPRTGKRRQGPHEPPRASGNCNQLMNEYRFYAMIMSLVTKRPSATSVCGFRLICAFAACILRLQIAQSRSCLKTLGPKVRITYVLGALGVVSSHVISLNICQVQPQSPIAPRLEA